MSSSRRKKARKKSAPKNTATAKHQAGKKALGKENLSTAKRASSKKRALATKPKATKPKGKIAAAKKSVAGQPAPKQSSGAKKKSPGAKPVPGKPAPGKKKPSAKKITKKKIAEEKARAEWEAVVARIKSIGALPENQNCVWLVELVIPPGSFIARRVEEPVDRAELDKEVEATTAALRHGNDPDRHRFLITYTDVGGVARQWAKAMSEEIPNPTVPMSNWDLFGIDAVLHAQFLGNEDY